MYCTPAAPISPIVPKPGWLTMWIEARLSEPSGSLSLAATLMSAVEPMTTDPVSLPAIGARLPSAGGGGGGGGAMTAVPLSLRMCVVSRCTPPSEDLTSIHAGAVGTPVTVSEPLVGSIVPKFVAVRTGVSVGDDEAARTS